ncbi:post-GPI attachment to proteins factor 3 [Marchantia polymorpha subsp. ruderalis]|uniref:Post-GPI attachment to proteins factor 3 n=2 Tax=Marchantia polymorpha TaxID=3197 RepID=A0AAF6BUQ8_MARPO|nr:hypothetical protein MARPO_0046s0083 [Marchantia polymorpha]BBN15742.1 hypothetical protein Mp_7g00410 [Marchantia polymorpha subsp. ruderalis]|eukprot:PTQ39265.1 hypothetical protein MARPO_0046s0083 [Marchantia polymorpha]
MTEAGRKMDAGRLWHLLLLLIFATGASANWHDSRFRSCLSTCETIGCVGKSCLPSCTYLNATAAGDDSQQDVTSPPLSRKWQTWICKTECDYHCTLSKETEEAGFSQEAIGYRDDWCLARSVDHHEESKKLYSHLLKTGLTRGFTLATVNEPASAAFCVLNILGNIIGLFAFFQSRQYSLPKRQSACAPYPYSSLWTGFGLLSILYWISRCMLHSREMAVDKHLESSFEILLSMYALCLAIMRVGKMKTEASRVIVAAPTLAFLYTHLMYINYCVYDYGLNMQLCLGLALVQYLIWISWVSVVKHPGRYQLGLSAITASLVVFLRLSVMNAKWPFFNGETEALWIASTLPLTFIWWSFAITDATYLTTLRSDKKATTESESKKDL